MPNQHCACTAERMKEIQKFEWVAADAQCPLAEWNATAFCASLGDRTLLFIGDSTSSQLSSVVHNYVTWGRGGCASQIFFERSDTLTAVNYGFITSRGRHWTEAVREKGADIV